MRQKATQESQIETLTWTMKDIEFQKFLGNCCSATKMISLYNIFLSLYSRELCSITPYWNRHSSCETTLPPVDQYEHSVSLAALLIPEQTDSVRHISQFPRVSYLTSKNETKLSCRSEKWRKWELTEGNKRKDLKIYTRSCTEVIPCQTGNCKAVSIQSR